MKKVIFILTMSLCFIFTFASCQTSKTTALPEEKNQAQSDGNLYTVHEVGNKSYSKSIFPRNPDKVFQSNTWKDNNASPVKSIKLMGKNISINYYESYDSSYIIYVTDVYVDSDMNQYYFRKDTGGFLGAFSSNKEKSVKLSDKERRKAADDFIKQYIDVEKYSASDERKTSADNCPTYYDYEYVKKIQGFDTEDGAMISLDECGNILFFDTKMVNAYDNINIPLIDKEKCNKTINSKLKSIYEIEGYSLDNYSSKTTLLLLNKDNSVSVIYYIAVNVKDNKNKIIKEDIILEILPTP